MNSKNIPENNVFVRLISKSRTMNAINTKLILGGIEVTFSLVMKDVVGEDPVVGLEAP